MQKKIQEINAIYSSFEMTGTTESILSSLGRFEEQTAGFLDDSFCYIVILWMKNRFLQYMNYYSRAEEILDEALSLLNSKKNPDDLILKMKLKVFLSLGYIHQAQCNFIDSDYFLNKALKIALANRQYAMFLGEIYSILADVNYHMDLYSVAKKYATLEKKVSFERFIEQKNDRDSAIIYAYSLINYCRIKRMIGLVDHTFLPSIEEALHLVKRHKFTKGILKTKLEYAKLKFFTNSIETASTTAREIEPELIEHRMITESIEAGLIIANVHKKLLDYSLAEAKLGTLLLLAEKNNLGQAQIVSDVYFIKGEVCYESDREKEAFDLFKQSAKIGMLGSVKRNIIRAYNAARKIDKLAARELLTSDLVYQDATFVRNRLAKQINPFVRSKTKAKLYASTLFVDIVGFSDLMKNSDEQLTIQMIDELIDRLCIIIYRNNGYIDKFLGDGFMVIFEHGKSLDKNVALNAIKAGVDMNRAVNIKNRRFKEAYNLDTNISFRMGMSTDEIFAIFLGNYIKREFTYLGNAVNLAAKLESLAERQGLLIDQNTQTLVKDEIVSKQKTDNLSSVGGSNIFHFHRLKRLNGERDLKAGNL